MRLCSMHRPWMMYFIQGTPTLEGLIRTIKGLGATVAMVQSPWTWTASRRGLTIPPCLPGVPTRSLVSVISVASLVIGLMSVNPLKLIRWDNKVPDTRRARARSPGSPSGLLRKWRSLTSPQKTRRRAAAPLCPPRRSHSRRCSWH